MDIPRPYLLFLGDAPDDLAAKTARGVLDWRPGWCLGQWRLPGCQVDLGLPDLPPGEAFRQGARTLLIGVANAGGVLPPSWIGSLVEALEHGLELASGLHMRLSSVPELRQAAERNRRRLFDLRHSDIAFATGKGSKRRGKRLLTVGTDCSVGKKYTALALEREMRARCLKVDFRATGQTGILIAGGGVAIDAVIADFISGAAEWLSPDNDPDHWDVVEGQGSLFHPSFAGVSLGLLHGTQPDAFVVCHEPTRRTMRGVATPLPTIAQVIEATIQMGRLTNPAIRCVGISVNTARLARAEADRLLGDLGREFGLPCVDPIATGVAPIVDLLCGAAAVPEGQR